MGRQYDPHPPVLGLGRSAMQRESSPPPMLMSTECERALHASMMMKPLQWTTMHALAWLSTVVCERTLYARWTSKTPQLPKKDAIPESCPGAHA